MGTALGTLLVYGITAAAAIAIAHRFVARLDRRVALLLALLPLLFTGPALVTGRAYAPLDILYDTAPLSTHRAALGVGPVRSPSLGDVVYQHLPWRAAVRRAVREGHAPLWNPNVLAGEPLLAVQQAGVLRPAVWIGMLLPPASSWTFDVTVRLFTALLGACLLLTDLGCGPAASVLGAAGWAFSDFLVFFLGFSIAPPTAPFPLALLGARRVARDPGAPSTALLAVALAAGLAGGHPETALHTGAAAALYFLFELAGARAGTRLRSVGGALTAACLALGLCAVVLLPMAEVLPRTAEHAFRKSWYAVQKRSAPPEESVFRLAPQLVPYGVGVDGVSDVKPGHLIPSSYAGVLLLPFAVVGLLVPRRERWFFLVLGLSGLAICARTPAADWIAKLPFFDIAINEYLIVWVTLAVAVLAALGADAVVRGQGRSTWFVAAVATAVAVALVHEHLRPVMNGLGLPPAYRHRRLLLQIAPLALAAAALSLPGKRRSGRGVAAAVAVFVAARVLEEGRVNPVLDAAAFYPPLSVLSKVPRGAPWRTTALGFAFLPNLAAVYDVEDVRGYSAMRLDRLRETFPLWCVDQGFAFNRIDDPAKPFLAFLNVRWVLLPASQPAPPGWTVLAEGEGIRLVENPAALPRVFVPAQVRAEPDAAKRLALLAAIEDFRDRGVVSEATADWTANGDARVTLEAYGAPALRLRSEGTSPTLVGTSIPAWPGWKAELDGQPMALEAYNHAFLAFRVPPGDHRILVRYDPDGFRRGLALSLASAAVLAAWAWRSRQRGSATTTA
ncbi:MAG TPA: YfhO family protein [Thermoanaerobaculia bacterium]|nr:YfhO family protein [Thermoanaerobaculia bacterium]